MATAVATARVAAASSRLRPSISKFNICNVTEIEPPGPCRNSMNRTLHGIKSRSRRMHAIHRARNVDFVARPARYTMDEPTRGMASSSSGADIVILCTQNKQQRQENQTQKNASDVPVQLSGLRVAEPVGRRADGGDHLAVDPFQTEKIFRPPPREPQQ